MPISITAALRTAVISIKRAIPALGFAASFASGTFACQIAGFSGDRELQEEGHQEGGRHPCREASSEAEHP